jgi:hypothetical protein
MPRRQPYRPIVICGFVGLSAFLLWAIYYMENGSISLRERLPPILLHLVEVFLYYPLSISESVLKFASRLAVGSAPDLQAIWSGHYRWLEISFGVLLTGLELLPILFLILRWRRLSPRWQVVFMSYPVCFLIAFVYFITFWHPPKPNIPIAVFGSQHTLDSFLSATDLTAERLYYRRSSPSSNSYKLESYDRGTAVPMTAKQASRVKQLFVQENFYGWQFSKMCAPNYGVLLTAHSGQSTVRIAICFECYMLGVYDSSEGNVKPVNRESDFVPPASSTFVRLTKELFPYDPEIQKLK